MNCETYLQQLRATYQPVGILSRKNGAMVMRMRHRTLGNDLILRHYPQPVAAYSMLCAIRHRNLPEVYDAVELCDGQIVLEESICGVTVSQALELRTYTYRGAKKVLQGVCAAMQSLHQLGLVHRDIKPENVMITGDGVVKLIDLNASRLSDPTKARDTQLLGTVGYASPEQLGIAPTDSRTDIYAMGVLLNVMLTGQHPSRMLAKGKAGRIVLRCTQIDPNSRYQTAAQLMNAL